jgi:hypothetical protein
MTTQDTTTKLAAIEASLKRWQTRLKRAATKVHELDRTRRRYQMMLLHPDKPEIATSFRVRVPKVPKVPKETPKAEVIAATSPPPGSLAEKYAAHDQALVEAAKEVDFPAFLNRADPHVAAKLTAARKKSEAEARKQMPLTGRDALKKIKEKK